jgi:hypothetical protein
MLPEEADPAGTNIPAAPVDLNAFLAAGPDRDANLPLTGSEEGLSTPLPPPEWFDFSDAPPAGARRQEPGKGAPPAAILRDPEPAPDPIIQGPVKPVEGEGREESLMHESGRSLLPVELFSAEAGWPSWLPGDGPAGARPSAEQGWPASGGVCLESGRARLWPFVVLLIPGSLAPLTGRQPRRAEGSDERRQRHESP